MKDIAMLNKAPLDFFGCNFCLVEKHRMAFVLISKCGLTFLENIAIYASIGMIPDTEDQTHFYIARVKPERFLVPVSEMSGYEREHKSYLKVAVWRDPVERLISAYKYFIHFADDDAGVFNCAMLYACHVMHVLFQLRTGVEVIIIKRVIRDGEDKSVVAG